MADRYSFSLTTFSPSGKLVQIEYALNAVSQGVTSIGIKATNGCVIATSKQTSSPLIDDTTIEKISVVCSSIGLVYSGMGPDARVLVDRARKAAQQYRRVYNEDPPVAILVKEVAQVMQEYTQSGGVRPFGVSLLVIGSDSTGHYLYQVDPSGSYFPWKATAIGKNMVNAKTFLEKRFSANLERDDACHTALLTLKEGFEGAMTESTVELGIAYSEEVEVTDSSQPSGKRRERRGVFRKLAAEEVKDYLANIA
ncbi:N-terminal nucleophile aminohydrolase [Gonapodya prolifera JEL478]|uniref:Proteasome subunit alpha type n=1 Tax=Gonapodya prolifera (strain JEL478) TaxID=1344416 RepID=A0A139APN4_GONPJ|nr:N-terminal nucleophile aminohydrolase [Gonapodya prolifera JEL478]|eukprot:KXS18717.1 N-terminal nucleophile aminohydrolase [Gonapodya prolifera JEL478]